MGVYSSVKRSGGPRVLVAARAGDPLFMEGRARLIWAANTADASARAGAEVWLACQGEDGAAVGGGLPLSPPNEAFCRFYGVEGRFEVLASPCPRWRRLGGKRLRESGNWEANIYLPQHVLPRVDVVQTRDFRLAAHAVRRGIPTIFEDHNESYHTEIPYYPREIVRSPAFRLAAGTTQAVRSRMIERGMPEEKTVVAWSGLNERSLRRLPADELERLREQFIAPGHRHLIAYAGGLHACRGIRLILQMAAERRDATFLILGGRRGQARTLRREAERRGLTNVQVLGYVPQQEVPAFLQAADAVIMPYDDAEEARITSPLKFFEYLASGTPVVAARLPELAPFQAMPDLAVSWCGISDFACFSGSLAGVLAGEGDRPRRAEVNQNVAASYTWTRRQELIFARAGVSLRAAMEEPVEQLVGAGAMGPAF